MSRLITSLIVLIFVCRAGAFNPYLESLSRHRTVQTTQSLQTTQAMPSPVQKLQELIKVAPLSLQTHVEVDSIFLNVRQFNSVCFKKNSRSVVLKSKQPLDNIYFIEGNQVFKLSDHTKIIAPSIRNILVYEMEFENDANGIIFNSKKNNDII